MPRELYDKVQSTHDFEERTLVFVSFAKPTLNDEKSFLCLATHEVLIFPVSENEVERRIRRIVLHSDYTTGNFNNDIALLHLEQPVEYNKFVKPICINDGAISYPTGTKCMVTGWGRTQNEIGPYSSILQQLEVGSRGWPFILSYTGWKIS